MKKLLAIVLIAFMTLPVFGQKYAYIDSEYILNNMPDYVEAQAELDRIAAEWQKEIEKQFTNSQVKLPHGNNVALSLTGGGVCFIRGAKEYISDITV